jgi:3-dehydroquinate dehydratase II
LAKSILIINGPNLNLLGSREPHIYGSTTLPTLEQACADHAAKLGLEAECYQSNHEGELIETIHAAAGKHDAIIINAGAYSHTSVGIRDALAGVALPVYEVHLSNVHAREAFRHHSYISAIARAVICGLGLRGYLAAIEAVAEA